MRTGLLLLIILLITTVLVRGQNFVFKVLAKKGQNHYKTVEIREWKPIEIGVELKENDVVNVGRNSYLGLIHRSGRIAELSKPGELKIADLESDIRNMKKGLPSKYIEFVFNTVASSESETISTRGIDNIHVYLPNSGEVYGDEILVMWDKYEDLNDYEVFITNLYNEEIRKISVTGTSGIIDLSIPELQDEQILILKVFSGDNQSQEYIISHLSDEKSESIQRELESFIKEIDMESPLGNVLLGAFYEENGLIVDSMYHYYLAGDPEEEDSILKMFLSRQGLLK